jgi:hypothetical protein
LSFICVTHPEQLDHGISESKTSIRCALSGVLISRSLMQAELNKFFCLGSTWSGADEQMVWLETHGELF